LKQKGNLYRNSIMKQNPLPFLLLDGNQLVGIAPITKRKPMYENALTKKYGMVASCNACDRIIFEDEKWKRQYTKSGGYCKECLAECQK